MVYSIYIMKDIHDERLIYTFMLSFFLHPISMIKFQYLHFSFMHTLIKWLNELLPPFSFKYILIHKFCPKKGQILFLHILKALSFTWLLVFLSILAKFWGLKEERFVTLKKCWFNYLINFNTIEDHIGVDHSHVYDYMD